MAKKQREKELPEKLSALIRVALEDLRAVERSKKYTVDMELWHEPQRGYGFPEKQKASECAVCLAGAVIARRLGGLPNELLTPNCFEDRVSQKLFALNAARTANIFSALIRTGCINAEEAAAVETKLDAEGLLRGFRDGFSHYDVSPADFKRDLAAIANRLEELGY